MKWWDDYAVPVFGLIGLIAVIFFSVISFFSIFMGVSELSGFEMGFGIVGVMGGCIIVAAIISHIIGLTPYSELIGGEEEEEEAEPEQRFVERRANRPKRQNTD